MKKIKGNTKRLLSLIITAAMVAGGVPQPANLVSANELNNKTPNEASTYTCIV